MQTKICGSLCLLAAAALLPGVYAETPPEVLSAIPHTEELLNVVVVSRHGVRSPTQSPGKTARMGRIKSGRAWPVARAAHASRLLSCQSHVGA